MAKKAHPVLKSKGSTQQLSAQQQPHKKRKREWEHGASNLQQQQQQQQRQQQEQVPAKKQKTYTSIVASVPVGKQPSSHVKHKQHAKLAQEATDSKVLGLKQRKGESGIIMKKQAAKKSRPWKGSSSKAEGAMAAQQLGSKAVRMHPNVDVHACAKGGKEKLDAVSSPSSKAEKSGAEGVKAGKHHRAAARARAKQKAARRRGAEENKEALVKAGSNWEALKAQIGATGKGAQLAREREAASGKKPRSLGSNTGITPIIALDCEMVGVGPEGDRSSLARVAVINEHGNVLLDVFVKQKEKVTDYRTKYSGVRACDVKSEAAVDLEEAQRRVAELMQGRLLVGHGLSNDLKAMMLDHPRKDTRDTARYLPFMHSPAPGRKHKPRALRVLASEILGLDIQAGEHSPVDDARAALYLYLRHKKEWEAALRSGTLKQQALAIKASRKAALAAAANAATGPHRPPMLGAQIGTAAPAATVQGAAEAAAAGAGAAVANGANGAAAGDSTSKPSKNAGLSAAQIRALRTGRGVSKVIGSQGAALQSGEFSQDGSLQNGRRNMAVGGWLDVVKGSAPSKAQKKGSKS